MSYDSYHARGTYLEPGSFRDPDGGIFFQDGRVYRYFNPAGAKTFLAATASGLFESLHAMALIIEQRQASQKEFSDLQRVIPQASLIIEHPRLPFLSYCYEWPFEMLRDAALCTLETLAEALSKGFILKDATPYNVQFPGPRPVFIDLASFEPYQEGQPWKAYNQFCRLFLNPLLLQSTTGVPFQLWLRGDLEGIDPANLSRVIPWHKKLGRDIFTHVVLQAWLNRHFAHESIDVSSGQTPVRKRQLNNLVSSLQKTIKALKPNRTASAWIGYEGEKHYHPEARSVKEAFVEKAIEASKPGMTWDLGSNTGLYSIIAARHSEYVVAMDSDPHVIDMLYQRVKKHSLKILPLVIDLMNPSPDAGWAQAERQGLVRRGPADMILCLALVHHLSLVGNLPFRNLMDWLSRVTRSGVIEFVPRSDPKAQELLRWKDDIYGWYSQEAFEEALGKQFKIAERCPLPHSGRILYHFESNGD